MLLIPCPWCGPREQFEFAFGGEAPGRRPADPSMLDDATWTDYLFTTVNVMGAGRYLVCHTGGCGQWFTVTLDTLTHEVGDPRTLGIADSGAV